MKNVFENINSSGLNPKKNLFDLSHTQKKSMYPGKLIPCMLTECIPGGNYRMTDEILVRCQPLVSPIMDMIDLKVNYYFVPWRLIWSNVEDWINKSNPAAVMPQVQINSSTYSQFTKGSLAEMFGIPPTTAGVPPVTPINISQLPFRAYQLIYQEHYRNQQVVDKTPVLKDDTLIDSIAEMSASNLFKVQKVQWEKDYFTACVPEPQYGDTVGIPVDIEYKEYSTVNVDGVPIAAAGSLTGGFTGDSASNAHRLSLANSRNARIENLESDGLTITVENLRWTVRLQEWAERMMRLGHRYVDILRGTFGAKVKDSRIDRPEYIGGGRIPISIGEVLNTSDTTNAVQGEMAGHGIGAGNLNWNYTADEHGYIVGIAHILPKTAYSQGINKMWTLTDAYDIAWPDFAQLGMQEVISSELYHDYAAAGSFNNLLFGYIPRYSHYKYCPSIVTGDLRDTLSHWNWARKFDNRPSLNQQFVECDPSLDIFAVEDGTDPFIVMIFHNLKAYLPLPYFNVPQL